MSRQAWAARRNYFVVVHRRAEDKKLQSYLEIYSDWSCPFFILTQRPQSVVKTDCEIGRELFVMHENEISENIIGSAIEVHRMLGPGLLESVYEDALCHELHLRGVQFKRQQSVPIPYILI